MMDGEAFLSHALQLAGSDKEERLRGSISRAYYGAYHVAREFVRGCGVSVPKRDVHIKLQWCLQQSGEKSGNVEVAEAGSQLADLRSDRNKADYDLDDEIIAKPANVIRSVAKAREIVDALAAFRRGSGMELIRPHVRSFAQQQGWRVL